MEPITPLYISLGLLDSCLKIARSSNVACVWLIVRCDCCTIESCDQTHGYFGCMAWSSQLQCLSQCAQYLWGSSLSIADFYFPDWISIQSSSTISTALSGFVRLVMSVRMWDNFEPTVIPSPSDPGWMEDSSRWGGANEGQTRYILKLYRWYFIEWDNKKTMDFMIAYHL